MCAETAAPRAGSTAAQHLGPGRLAQIACLLEVTAQKPGNVHRVADLPGLHFIDFLLSATAIAEPLDRAATAGVGRAVYEAVVATRRVVNTNTNLGIVLLLAPLAAVPIGIDLPDGIEAVLAATTVEDAKWVYRAIRLAAPGGLGEVPEQDVKDEPTVTLREAMVLAADRDLIARQFADGYRVVFDDALPALQRALGAGQPLEMAIIAGYLTVLAHHPDSLVARKHGLAAAGTISDLADRLLATGWPNCVDAEARRREFDTWLRQPSHRFNPGTSADLVTAALFVGLREGTIGLPAVGGFPGFSDESPRQVATTASAT
jgi:triphosphoribosyl-dephospho-CoA synthase